MRSFLEQYGTAIFTLVLMAILIVFAVPVGKMIKNNITTKIESEEILTSDEMEIAKGNYYTIIFDGNGATSGTMEPMKVICGRDAKLPSPSIFMKNGQRAISWNTELNGNGYIFGSTVSSDIVQRYEKNNIIKLYAQYNCVFDLNGFLDFVSTGNINGYGTVDIYINGKLVGKSVTDFYKSYPVGTVYEIKNIKPTSGHTYDGVQSGKRLKGTITSNTCIKLIFNTIKDS